VINASHGISRWGQTSIADQCPFFVGIPDFHIVCLRANALYFHRLSQYRLLPELIAALEEDGGR
jgi:hypothetical protein